MKRIGISLLVASVIALANAPIQAVNKAGTTAAQFLKIGVGARAVSLGEAFVALANDASALYWNPAGISRLEGPELLLVHTQWLANTYYNFAGFVLPLGEFGTVGATFCTLNMDEMLVRTLANPEGTGERFAAGDFAVGISYARNLTDRFSIGFNGKYIRQKIWLMHATSFAFDVGTLFFTQFKGLRIGMSISNFGNKLRMEGDNTLRFYDEDPTLYGNNDRIPTHLDTERWELPLLFRVGIAIDVLDRGPSRLTYVLDAVHPNDNPEKLNMGMEYTWADRVALRAGYKALFSTISEEGLTLGAGFRFELNLGYRTVLHLDYAYADFGRLRNAQRFSLRLEF